MIRGTTPLLLINITSGALPWLDATELEVYIADNCKTITKVKTDCTYDAENVRLLVQLTQADTLSLSVATARVQIRYQLASGQTFASNVGYVAVDNVLKGGIIGREDVAQGYEPAVASITVADNYEVLTIGVDYGTKIEGGGGTSDIKYIAKNGTLLQPSAEGVVNIVVPTKVGDLADGEEIKANIAESKEIGENAKNLAQEASAKAIEVEGKVNSLNIPTSVSDLADGSALVADVNTAKAEAESATSKAESATATANEAKSIAEGISVPTKTSELANDSGFITSTEVAQGYQPKGNYLTEHQPIKTLNGNELVGEGNVEVKEFTDADRQILQGKQDKLTAGENITIADDGTISASIAGTESVYEHYARLFAPQSKQWVAVRLSAHGKCTFSNWRSPNSTNRYDKCVIINPYDEERIILQSASAILSSIIIEECEGFVELVATNAFPYSGITLNMTLEQFKNVNWDYLDYSTYTGVTNGCFAYHVYYKDGILDIRSLQLTKVNALPTQYSYCAFRDTSGTINPRIIKLPDQLFTGNKPYSDGTWWSPAPESIRNLFCGCTQLEEVNLSAFNTQYTTVMERAFYNCSSLRTINLSSWNVGAVTTMASMFYGCSNLSTIDLSTWDMSKVTNTTSMFSGCKNLTKIYAVGCNEATLTLLASVKPASAQILTEYDN